jgi:hypothetical protein
VTVPNATTVTATSAATAGRRRAHFRALQAAGRPRRGRFTGQEPRQVGGQRLGAGVAPAGPDFQTFQADRLQVARHARLNHTPLVRSEDRACLLQQLGCRDVLARARAAGGRLPLLRPRRGHTPVVALGGALPQGLVDDLVPRQRGPQLQHLLGHLQRVTAFRHTDE